MGLKKHYVRLERLEGFTLLEVAIVLLIIGIIGAGIFKGQELIATARIRAVSQDLERYRLAFIHYQETYNALPGDDKEAPQRFGSDASQGNGNHIIDEDDIPLVWIHLHKANLIGSPSVPSSRMGGVYRFVHQPADGMTGHWLELSDGDGHGIFTPKQVQSLKTKIDDGQSKHNEGSLRAINDSSGSHCITEGHLNLTNDKKSCIIYYQLN